MSKLYEKYCVGEGNEPADIELDTKQKFILSIFRIIAAVFIIMFIFPWLLPWLGVACAIIGAFDSSTEMIIASVIIVVVFFTPIVVYIKSKIDDKGSKGIMKLAKKLGLKSEDELDYYLAGCERVGRGIFISDKKIIHINYDSFSVYDLNNIHYVSSYYRRFGDRYQINVKLHLYGSKFGELSYVDDHDSYEKIEKIKEAVAKAQSKNYNVEPTNKKYSYY